MIDHQFGYIFGELNPILKRNTMSTDIYFIYIKPNMRQNGNGKFMVTLFEKEASLRYYEIISKSTDLLNYNFHAQKIEIRIANKHCIRKNTPFWNKNGFNGDINSDQLTKLIYL